MVPTSFSPSNLSAPPLVAVSHSMHSLHVVCFVQEDVVGCWRRCREGEGLLQDRPRRLRAISLRSAGDQRARGAMLSAAASKRLSTLRRKEAAHASFDGLASLVQATNTMLLAGRDDLNAVRGQLLLGGSGTSAFLSASDGLMYCATRDMPGGSTRASWGFLSSSRAWMALHGSAGLGAEIFHDALPFSLQVVRPSMKETRRILDLEA